jgi:hypothetical protein
VFTVADALAAGVSRNRLARSDLAAPFHGVRSTRPVVAESELLVRCLEYAPRLAPWQFFSHETALALVGAPMPEWPYQPRVHVSAHRPAREPRTVGVVGHRLQARESAVINIGRGLRVEHPVRAWRQAGGTWRLDDLIAAGDFLVSGDSPLITVGELRAEIDRMGDVRRRLLKRSIGQVRVGPRSARETHLRLLLGRAGLPEPDLNWNLLTRQGELIAELDLAYIRWRVAVEYDGRVHAEDSVQFAKDADRWDRIRAAGWQHVRILNHHMADAGRSAVTKVQDALLSAGWRPGAA